MENSPTGPLAESMQEQDIESIERTTTEMEVHLIAAGLSNERLVADRMGLLGVRSWDDVCSMEVRTLLNRQTRKTIVGLLFCKPSPETSLSG